MLDFFNLAQSTRADVQVFGPNSAEYLVGGYKVWNKPRGVSMCHILCLGPGGNGGNGTVGALNAAGGGGGGGSGAQSTLLIPAMFLPDTLFVQVTPSTAASRYALVGIANPTTVNGELVIYADGATGNGGNASGATAGAAGAGAPAVLLSACPIAGMGRYNFLAGQAGAVGGSTAVGGSITLPTTGLVVTGGAGGGGNPNSTSIGSNGGSFVVAGKFPPHLGATAGNTTNGGFAQHGAGGINGVIPGLFYNYGGTGGSTPRPINATFSRSGGDGGAGAYGCGGGGGSGCITGGAGGFGGKGGDGLVVIMSW